MIVPFRLIINRRMWTDETKGSYMFIRVDRYKLTLIRILCDYIWLSPERAINNGQYTCANPASDKPGKAKRCLESK